jgi:uncharacterized OsmC-like protein
VATKVIDQSQVEGDFVRRKAVKVSNDATTRSLIDAGEYGVIVTDEPTAHGGTGAGPSPLQTVLGALCGCESVTFHRTAQEYDFAYDGIEFEAAFTIDIRGRKGDRTVRPHFQSVKVQATVRTDEPEDRLAEVVEETEARCPVFNLINDAGVQVEMLWVRSGT